MGHQQSRHLGALVHDNGVDFCVWAPFAQKVQLILWDEFSWQAHDMTKDNAGYWSIEDVDASPGRVYKYRITTADGRTLEKNDPYARQLTDTENGSSVIVVRDFEWEGAENFTPVTNNEAVIYELHVGTFHRPDASTGGTFASAIEKLAYLQQLGVTHVELMPVTSMATSHGWGYSPSYIFSIENAYGGRHQLLEFVKACHEAGIGVIIDVVYNHFFGGDLWQYDGWSENNRGGIYFFNDARGDTPWGGRPDYGRPEVRQFLLDNVAMWFTEYKIDGLRLDSTIYMRNIVGDNERHDTDIPEAWSLLGEITQLAHKIHPHALMIAEDNSTNAGIVMPKNKGGMGFDAQWEIGFPHVIRDALGISSTNRARLEGIEWALGHSYRGDAFDKVIFGDSHDTAANGSTRLNEAATPGNAESATARQKILIASAVALSAPGIPMLLQGQEFMQEGAFNEWKMLEWDKTSQFAGIVTAHQHLIALRRNMYGNTKGLTGQHTAVFHRNDTDTILGFHRWEKGGSHDDTIVIVNFCKQHFDNYSLVFPRAGTWRVRFNSTWKGYSSDFHETKVDEVTTDTHKTATLPLGAYGVLILSQD